MVTLYGADGQRVTLMSVEGSAEDFQQILIMSCIKFLILANNNNKTVTL